MAQNVLSLRKFVDQSLSAQLDDFREKPYAAAVSDGEFKAMKEHIADFYTGVEAEHSFVDDNGQVFDCVPFEQQPSLRNHRGEIAKPPEHAFADEPDASLLEPLLRPDRKDVYGNAMWCPSGTVPICRVSLDILTRYKKLSLAIRKDQASRSNHKHAVGRQSVGNGGGASTLNVWAPEVSLKKQQVFSLSQQWYVAETEKTVQTVEGGWKVDPLMFRGNRPCLFIYYTPDDYKSGCYNTLCTAFIQTPSNQWPLGMAFKPSSPGAANQTKFKMYWILVTGAQAAGWWLYINGSDPFANAVGHYPLSVFKNGPMTKGANLVQFGGETDGKGNWPPMGSGEFANGGIGKAAFQLAPSYFPSSNSDQTLVPAKLTLKQGSPSCYTVVEKKTTDNKNCLLFGGPGGTNC